MLKVIYPNGMVLVYERGWSVEHTDKSMIIRRGNIVLSVIDRVSGIAVEIEKHDRVEFIRPPRAEQPARPKSKAPRLHVLHQVQF